MATVNQKLFAQALRMKKRERELLALELWRSLDDVSQEEVWDAWAVEINRRLLSLERGDAKSIPAEQAIREARKLVRKKQRV